MSRKLYLYLRQHHFGLIAIFIALSGTAYAVDGPLAGQNTVGSEDIIRGEVRRPDIGPNAVSSGAIADGAVGTADVADDTTTGALTGADVANESLNRTDVQGLTGADVKANSLTGADIKDDTVISSDVTGIWGPDVIANGLTGNDITDLAGPDIRDNSVGHADLENFYKASVRGFAAGNAAENHKFRFVPVSAFCNDGDIAITGGTSWGTGTDSSAYDAGGGADDLARVLSTSRPVIENGQPVGWVAVGGWDEAFNAYFWVHAICLTP